METLAKDINPVEEMPVVCPYSVQKNLHRFAARHTVEELRAIAHTTKYAGYANFDEVDHPDADFI